MACWRCGRSFCGGAICQIIFEVYDYENGTFGIGFKGDVPEDLAGKTVTLNLNVYLAGNTSAKPNGTVKAKLTIMK